VETVDEFEAEGEEYCQAQQNCRGQVDT